MRQSFNVKTSHRFNCNALSLADLNEVAGECLCVGIPSAIDSDSRAVIPALVTHFTGDENQGWWLLLCYCTGEAQPAILTLTHTWRQYNTAYATMPQDKRITT